MARRQRSELTAPAVEERIVPYKEPACSQLHRCIEGRFDVGFAAGVEDMKLQSDRASCGLNGSPLYIGIRTGWVQKYGDYSSLWIPISGLRQKLGIIPLFPRKRT